MRPSIVILIVCFVFACDRRASFEGGDREERQQMVFAEDVPSHTSPPSPKVETLAERKVIKTGFLNIPVDKVGDTKTEIEKICKQYDAYISSETQATYGDRVEISQVIRIPAANFDGFVLKVESLGVDVNSKNIQTSDVTEEFIDKEARIKTKKELENRYREILKQAEEVSDILSIEAQLNHVRADIESMQGRLNYLQSQVAYSTLTLTFYEAVGPESGYASKTLAALGNGWDMLLIFIIALVNVWPFLLIGAVLVVIAFRRKRFSKIRSTES